MLRFGGKGVGEMNSAIGMGCFSGASRRYFSCTWIYVAVKRELRIKVWEQAPDKGFKDTKVDKTEHA